MKKRDLPGAWRGEKLRVFREDRRGSLQGLKGMRLVLDLLSIAVTLPGEMRSKANSGRLRFGRSNHCRFLAHCSLGRKRET